MSLIRSILLFGWIALMAAYGSRQVISISFDHNARQSKDISYLFTNEHPPSLFFQSGAKENVLKTAQQEPFLKWVISNAQYIITSFICGNFTFLVDFEANRMAYISRIIFPFHTFW